MPLSLDQVLILVAITAYIISTLALLTYLLSREPLAKRVGVPFAFVGCITQFVELVVRYQTSHIWPLTNLYGSLSLFSAMSVAIFIVFALRYDLWFLGGFVEALAAGFLAYGLTWNEGYLPPVPALQSYWIKIHVPLVVSSYAAFMVAAVCSAIYLIKYYFERSLVGGARRALRAAAATPSGSVGIATMQRIESDEATIVTIGESPNIEAAAAAGNVTAQWLATLPSLAKLDIMTYRIIAVGLPLLTVGIITGAWWAKEAWGAYWQWDPKETAALSSWILYAAYMHLHTRNAWRGVRCAWVSMIGFASIMFCYLGVNIWISGLHSYKM
ncbi:MAG: c-type cytochrome biogenesis protein CcsB [Candidatus Eremiobacteraeota bacterium]|nr:c-type cytochrome biogenesis protein CcsB [Candidatus Eremiobacteraeota bacterium]